MPTFFTIPITVTKAAIEPIKAVFGVKGSAGVSVLAVTLDDNWAAYTNVRLTFFDATGSNPKEEFLPAELLTDNVYHVVIPHEALAIAGNASMVIDAQDADGRPVSLPMQGSVKDTLTPGGSVSTEEIDALLQLQAELAQSMQDAAAAKAAAEAAQADGEELIETAQAASTGATQALSDLLAMLGTDIATLTGGKLTPSQIPALAINDTFPVANTAAMVALDAQRGDVALIVANLVVTDSYILTADDPTVLANWVKLGVSYVAEAGHAVAADNAADSTMINGHRLVEMTAAQYASAVKDPDTYYLVSD